ncbi:hypothetical protein [Anaplasma phagocytophilum]|nr:hypothetical protein [Anaplasma phagocytophilum]AGR79520.1 hypothetical protein YYU_03945 [Anaplasma phagocytophilum str. HZ2]AGR80770.1 hypothetical protein WSQ_03950 [Anaplasma phagocytophilum str. JM]AGR82022.1 hypothetical protein YYY_03940 [Anaplasma phagocytophilum str. Dog2]EOA61123.1 hypothetical protein HGE1_03682 [Anaplasma phagocytophilum str. HGE1]PLC10227.1 hypothetical protein C0V68_02295 [Anaplasma phagocytophilum]
MVEYIYQAMLIDDHAADFFCKIICTFKVAKRFSSVAEYVLLQINTNLYPGARSSRKGMALSEINRMSTQFYAVQPTSRDCGIKKCQHSSSFVFYDLARMSGPGAT